MPRLFVALEIPEEHRRALCALERRVSGARWVPEVQLHLTLKFVGEVSDQTAADVKAILAEVRAAPFRLALSGAGTFPPRGAPRVLWAGVEPAAPVRALALAVEDAVEAAGVAGEARAFHPHLTLARLKEARPAQVAAHVEQVASLALPAFLVDRFILFSSVLSSSGATHAVEREYALST